MNLEVEKKLQLHHMEENLTLLHQIFCSVVAFVGSRLQLFELTAMPRDVYLKGVVPVGACYAIALWFGNWAYLYLQVSFVQMLKAFMPVTVFFIGICIGTEKFNLRLCGIYGKSWIVMR